jgi:hypothetical protein
MTGTPQSSGIFDFTVQVTDSTGVTASKSLTLVVDLPKLTITTATPLPGGPVGTAYSQKFSAIGGTAPYTWTLAAGFIPGLSVDFIGGVLSGTPTDSGTFNFSVQATDSKGQTGTKAFSITITPGPPSITTDAQLPDGTFGVPFLQAIQAIGGTAPYAWSASRLPDGLNLDSATGIISGTPQTAGTFAFTVTLTDSARLTSTARFNLTIGLPPLPTVNISGLPATANAADQLKAHLELSSPYPAPVSGQLLLTFVSDVGGNDGTIQFSTGGRTAAFTIPANTTAATPDLSIQTGTVAGTIRLVAQFQSFGIDITSSPAPTVTTHVNPAAPTIVSTKLVRTTNGFSIQVTGYSTSREVTQAVFHFTAASGNTLQSGDVAVSVQSMFAQWFQDASSTAFGSQFTFTQPFTVQGDSNAVIPGSITLTNSLGSNTANIVQ